MGHRVRTSSPCALESTKTMNLAERMKLYESMETGRKVLPRLPVCIRVDGRAFHNATKVLEKPFDADFHSAMVETAQFLAAETNAKLAYVQSDEITLIIYEDKSDSQIFFDGKIFRLTSVIASMATAKFNELELMGFPTAQFDCRVWTVPNLEEAANVILWRELDATRNSIQSAARSVYSHKQCLNKNTGELQEMLFQQGINWNDYPDSFKRGTFVFPRIVRKPMSEKHKQWCDYRKFEYERTEWQAAILPPLLKVTNRVEVLFSGAEPQMREESNDRT